MNVILILCKFLEYRNSETDTFREFRVGRNRILNAILIDRMIW